MKNEPDFYLVPNECVPVVYPIKCWIEGTLQNKDGYFIVDIYPEIIYGDKDGNILRAEKAILSARYKNENVRMVGNHPIFVNILWKKKEHHDMSISALTHENIEIIALGKVYLTADLAWEDVHKAFEQNRRY